MSNIEKHGNQSDEPSDTNTLETSNLNIQSEHDVIVSKGDIVGHDKNINTSGGDYVEGDYVEGDSDKRRGIFIDLRLEAIITALKNFLPNYIQIFIGILVSPKNTFANLFEGSKNDSYRSFNTNWDERPIIFAGLSLLIGVVLAKSFSIKGAPSDYSFQTLLGITLSQIILWVIYGLGVYAAAKIFGGTGTALQTITGTLYVLATVHILLIVSVYFISSILTNTLNYSPLQTEVEYREVLITPDRDKPPEFKMVPYNKVISDEKLILFGWDFRTVFYLASSSLIAFYLYFPIATIHKLSKIRTILLFAVGIGVIVFVFILGIGFIVALLGTALSYEWYSKLPYEILFLVCLFLAYKFVLRIKHKPNGDVS